MVQNIFPLRYRAQGPVGPSTEGGAATDLWLKRSLGAGVAMSAGTYSPMHDALAPADWESEVYDGTTVTVTPKTINGVAGATLAECSRYEHVYLAKLNLPNALVAGDTVQLVILTELITGSDEDFRLRITDRNYAGNSAPEFYQRLRVTTTPGSFSATDAAGDRDIFIEPASGSSVTVAGNLRRVTIDLTVAASPPADLTEIWFGVSPDTTDEVWDFALEDMTVSGQPVVAGWSDQDGATHTLATVDLDTASGPSAPPLALSAVALMPSDTGAHTLILLTDGADWTASVGMDASGDLLLSLVELTQGTLTATAALPAVAETEAIAYTLHIEADGAVNLYADGTQLASVAGTAGDLPASGLTATLTAPSVNPELVRAHLGIDPRWTPPAEILIDVVDGVAVNGWLYGETT